MPMAISCATLLQQEGDAVANREHIYRGKDIDIGYVLKRCIHSGECLHHLPGVFDTRKRPWVRPDGDEAEAAARVIEMCPTGALHFTRKDGGAPEHIPAENTITVVPDGPLYFRGNLEIVRPDGAVILRDTRVALCRCGASRNKPLCDNAHIEAYFEDGGGIAEQPMPPLEPGTPPAPLRVTVKPNGSLRLEGPFRMHSERRSNWVSGCRTALCRCGASQHKPFCDGSHKTTGFAAE
jgi:CDGSH-type Zn-finger protein/uncharacterized Fe-S cluster protein YjdI